MKTIALGRSHIRKIYSVLEKVLINGVESYVTKKRWQNWIDIFYRKLRLCLKHLQNTKDLRTGSRL